MARILYLVHRLPYPPNKGDKVRSYHLLRHLAERHEVYLGTFVDDRDDLRHIVTLRQWCAEVRAIRLRPTWARVASLAALIRGEPLTQAYFRSRALHHWVCSVSERVRPEVVVAFSSSMVQYARHVQAPLLMDLVDLDSEKWTEYAKVRRPPWSWIFAREARTLRALEVDTVARARFACFVTTREAELFARRSGGRAGPVHVVGNGVDTDYFAPHLPLPDPYPPGATPVVFTGAMDYAPNIDAMRWFCAEVWPELVRHRPGLHLYIVGRHPVRSIRRLAGATVCVTGTVDDVRPFLRHARLGVAPMRLARGIHNKILEAMAMGLPVITSDAAAQSLDAPLRSAVATATDARSYIHLVDALLDDIAGAAQLGHRARAAVVKHCRWPDRMAAFDGPLQACLTEAAR